MDAKVLPMNRWLGVEIRHLAALEAIHAERSFRGAADRLGYVQSAVSQQISALERLVGARLVERARGQTAVELTASGKLLLEHSDRIIAQLNAARADLDALVSGATGVLRVGAFQSISTRVMPRVLARIAVRQPGLQVVATEASSDRLLFEQVERGELDVAFAELPLEPGPFDSMELVVDPCVLVVRRGAPITKLGRPPTLREIAAMPLAFPNWRMTDVIVEDLRAAGLAPERSSRLETNTAVQALAAAGLAAAIMPLLAVDPTMRETEIVGLDGLLPDRRIVLYWHSDRLRRPVLDSFAETVKGVCREIGGFPPDFRPPSSTSRVIVLRPAPADDAPGTIALVEVADC